VNISPGFDACTLRYMSIAILILLVEVVVFAALMYVAVRFGVRDGMTDFEKRKRGDSRDPNP
jgi:hypothetical protein